jgi:hypothetical protein
MGSRGAIAADAADTAASSRPMARAFLVAIYRGVVWLGFLSSPSLTSSCYLCIKPASMQQGQLRVLSCWPHHIQEFILHMRARLVICTRRHPRTMYLECMQLVYT